MWKTRNLSTFPSFPHKNVILFLIQGKVYTFPAKSKKNLYTFPAKCILFPLSVKRIYIQPVIESHFISLTKDAFLEVGEEAEGPFSWVHTTLCARIKYSVISVVSRHIFNTLL